MAKQDDGLFLLEALVEKIVFLKSPCFSDKDFRTCVEIQCLSVDPLEICDDDPGTCFAKGGGPFEKTFNSGKSCLFSLQESEISKAMNSFPIKITVFKSLPCGCIPTKIVMGEATIDMTKEFVQARKNFLEDPDNVKCEAIKDTFQFLGPDQAETGRISMFLRVSCFGKLIITRFQGGPAPPNLGAGRGSSIVDRSCTPHRDYQTPEAPCVCGAAKSAAGPSGSGAVCNAPCTPGSQVKGFGVCPTVKDPYDSMPCEDPDDPCYCNGPKPEKPQKMVCRNTHQYCLHLPKDCCPPGNKVVFQLPTDSCALNHKQRAHFNFTSDGVGDVSRDEPGQIIPSTAEEYTGVVYDFPDNAYKIRIKKYVEMPGRKSKLEYSFVTPPVTQEKVIPVKDTRTCQYKPCCSNCCPAKPCCFPLSLPLYQDLNQDQIINIESASKETRFQQAEDDLLINIFKAKATIPSTTGASFDAYSESLHLSMQSMEPKVEMSNNSFNTIKSNRRSVSFSNPVDHISKLYKTIPHPTQILFGKEEAVFMTLFNELGLDFCRRRTSGTQATASINKCLQVSLQTTGEYNPFSTDLNHWLSSNMSSVSRQDESKDDILSDQFKHPSVYFLDDNKKRVQIDKTGMGSSRYKTEAYTCCPQPKVSKRKSAQGVQTKSANSSSASQTKASSKAVCIKVDNSGNKVSSSPEDGATDMVGTVSHIRIGPKVPCNPYGFPSCQGPICALPIAGNDNQAPVKVTTTSNPRRGVFEIVIRRMTEAPLAKNELMLEWTPPSARTCQFDTCPALYPVTICRPQKCKPVLCKPSKYCKKRCRPCGSSCRSCRSPCSPPCVTPCSPPCGPPCGRPCKSPCDRPCRLSCGRACASPCGPPCRSPCVTPCKRSCASPCKRSCRSPCKRPCKSPCRRPCESPCSPPCRSPCRRSCRKPCTSCRKPCGSICATPCGSPCGSPCRSPCRSPCKAPCRPPPCRSPCKSPCGSPCQSPCVSPCDPPCGSPCKSPCRSPCGPPCAPSPCRPPRCKRRPCKRCCKKPRCKPCRTPCVLPCPASTCSSPCKSSPCIRPCPVGYKKPRKIRSQPKMKPHRKRISPCWNRSSRCSTMRCRSGPCISCNDVPCVVRKCSTLVCPPKC